jgi:tRNA(adenine34) deaminase
VAASALDPAVDHLLMRFALEQARLAGEAGDVPIGAVIVDGSGDVLAIGRNEREKTGDPTAHAEIVALRAAAVAAGVWNLSGTTIAVTVEPCTMCAGALVAARVTTLIFGCREPKTGAAGSLWDVVRDPRLPHRLQVRGDVLAEESATLLREFFARRR